MIRAIAASEVGHDLAKKFEAPAGVPELVAYKHSGDPVTIGFGHTGPIIDPETGELRPLTEADVGVLRITPEYAEELYRDDSQEAERRVDKYFPDIPLTQGQRDALFSFCYNLRLTSIRTSTLRKMILGLEGKSFTRATLIEWWVKYRNPNTIFEEGLFRRRIAELCLWFGWPYEQAWSAELRRDRVGNIAFMSNPELILRRAELEAEAKATPEPVEADPEPELEPFPDMPAPQAPVVLEPLPDMPAPQAPVVLEPLPDMPAPVVTPDPPLAPPPVAAPPQVPTIPYGKVDPAAVPKDMIASKRFWGLLILVVSRFTFVGLAGQTVLGSIVGDPILFDTAAASLAMAALFFCDTGGQWLSWFGRKKATRTLK